MAKTANAEEPKKHRGYPFQTGAQRRVSDGRTF